MQDTLGHLLEISLNSARTLRAQQSQLLAESDWDQERFKAIADAAWKQFQEYELAAELSDREVKLRDRIAKLEVSWHKTRDDERPIVDEKAIVQIVLVEL